MIEYSILAFSFVTLIFIAWLIVSSTERIWALLSIIVCGFIVYITFGLARDYQESKTEILLGSFLLELFILFFILFLKRKESDTKLSLIVYGVLIFLSYAIAKGVYNSQNKKMISEFEENLKIESYKGLYEFDVDSLSIPDLAGNINAKNREKMKFPIIAYRKLMNQILFDYDLNMALGNGFKTFKYDSIRTIVIIEDKIIDVGEYSNSKTKAKRIETCIEFIDFKNRDISRKVCILGPLPPQSVSYKGGAPKEVFGKALGTYEIIKIIEKELK